MSLAILCLLGMTMSLVASGVSLLATSVALKSGVAATSCLTGGYRRDEQPLIYWYFVGISSLGFATFLGLAIFALHTALGW